MEYKQRERLKMEYRDGYVGDKKIIGRKSVKVEAHTRECETRGEGCYLPGWFKYKVDAEGRRYRTKFHRVDEHTVSIPILEGESQSKV